MKNKEEMLANVTRNVRALFSIEDLKDYDRLKGYSDGYIQAMLDMGVCTWDELKSLIDDM